MGSDDFFVGRQHKMMLVGNQNQFFFAVQAHVVQRFGCFNGFMRFSFHWAVGGWSSRSKARRPTQSRQGGVSLAWLFSRWFKPRGFYAFSGSLKRIQSKRLYAVLKRFSGCIQGQSSGFFRNSYRPECKQLFHVVFLSTKFTQFEKYNKKTTRFR